MNQIETGMWCWMRWLLASLGLIAVILCGPRASAESDSSPMRRLLRVTNVKALRNLKESDAKLQKQKRICDVQLRDELIPSACFEVLRAERKLGLAHDAGRTQTWLEDICRERAETEKNLEVLESVLPLLPDRCGELVETRIGDLRYQRQTSVAAVEVFAHRFSDRDASDEDDERVPVDGGEPRSSDPSIRALSVR